MARTKGTIKVDARKTTAGKAPPAAAKRVSAAKKKKDAGVLYAKASQYRYDKKKQDLTKARKLYQQASEMGHADAMVELGFMYDEGLGGEQDHNKEKEWYQKAARKGHPVAMRNLGIMYDFGQGGEQDYVKAKEWYLKSAKKGDSQAMRNLGIMYELGQGGEQDYVKAKEWCLKAAKNGDAEAMDSLGLMYQNGKGGEQDYVKAKEWFMKAAREGHAGAMQSLGYMYDKGLGGDQDFTKALEWYQKASDKGLKVASFNVGYMHMYGHGVEQDYTQALELFQEASDRGDDGATVVIGYMHSKGYGVPEAKTKAEEWYKKGVALDNPFAMWLLIDMCRGDERREEVLALYQRVISIVPEDPVEDYFEGQDLADVRKAIADSREWCDEQFGTVQGPRKRQAQEQPEAESNKKKPRFGAGIVGFGRVTRVRDDGLCFYRCVLESTRDKLQLCGRLNLIEGDGEREIAAIDTLRKDYVGFLDHLRETEDEEWEDVKIVAERLEPDQTLDALLGDWRTRMLTPARTLQREGKRGEWADELVYALTPRMFKAMGFDVDLRIGHWVGAAPMSSQTSNADHTIWLQHQEGLHFDLYNK
jgi:TPR repeat protein